MRSIVARLHLLVLSLGSICMLPCVLVAQKNASDPPPVTFTAEQDHRDMMDQLGIKQLRPGFSGDESAPNHANYDPASANPFPKVPDALTLKNGKKVTTPETWWQQRRPEIVEDYEREVYGRVPKNMPKVTWTVSINERERVGRIPVVAKQLLGQVDNSAYPQINVNISMVLVTPAEAKGPVPVLMMFARSVLPAPVQPTPEEVEQINAKLKALLSQSDPAIKAIFEQYPAYNPIPTPPPFANFGGRPPGSAAAEPTPTEELIAAGWGYARSEERRVGKEGGSWWWRDGVRDGREG